MTQGILTICLGGILFGLSTGDVCSINSVCRVVQDLHGIWQNPGHGYTPSMAYTLDTVNEIPIDNQNSWEYYQWYNMYYNTTSNFWSYGKNGENPSPSTVKPFPAGFVNSYTNRNRDKLSAMNLVLRFAKGNPLSMFEEDCNDDPTRKITVYDAIVFCIMRREQILSKEENNPEPTTGHTFNYDRYRMMMVLFSMLRNNKLTNMIRNQCLQPGGTAKTDPDTRITIGDIDKIVNETYMPIENLNTQPDDFSNILDVPKALFETGTPEGLLGELDIRAFTVQFLTNPIKIKHSRTDDQYKILSNRVIENFYTATLTDGAVDGLVFFDDPTTHLTMRVAGLLPIARMFFYAYWNLFNFQLKKNKEFWTESATNPNWINYMNDDHRLYHKVPEPQPQPQPPGPKPDGDNTDTGSNSGIVILVLIGLVAGYALTRKRKA